MLVGSAAELYLTELYTEPMTTTINFKDCTLAIRDFEGVQRDNDNIPVNYLVMMDLATPLASELEHLRARWARKLVALLRPNDRLSIWWFTSNELYGSFLHNQEILDPTKEVPDYLEKFLTFENLKAEPTSLGELVAKVNHLYVEASGRKQALVGYTDVEGFMLESAATGLFTLLANTGRFLRAMYLCEYSCGDETSSLFIAGSNLLGRKFFFGKNQFEEQTSFESAVREIAGEKMAEINISRAYPPENYGFVTFLYERQPFFTPCGDDDIIILPAGVTQFAYFSDEVPTDSPEFFPQLDNSPLVWVAVSHCELVDEDLDSRLMLKTLGDVYLGNLYVDATENEDFCRFEAACLEAAFDERFRYRQGVTRTVAELSNTPASEVEDMLQKSMEESEALSRHAVEDRAPLTLLKKLERFVMLPLAAAAGLYLLYYVFLANSM